MKKNLLSLQFLLLMLVLSATISAPIKAFAAFPIAAEQITINEHNSSEKIVQQKEKKQIFNLKQKPAVAQGEDKGVFGIVSFSLATVCLILGLSVVTAGFLPFLMLLGAFVTGIIGVQRRRKLKGLAIAGLVVGSVAIVLLILAIAIIAALA
ncbi:MAG: hypothetical protein IT256_09255 [Chitinophagaceae bacterium]|nr:hypothetical protein [Chitinophagaceae bacterium]